MRVGALLLIVTAIAWGQAPPAALSLTDAQAIALRNHPRIASAALSAQASESVVKEARAAYFPIVTGNITAVGSEPSSTLSAGNIQTSSIYNRASSGLVASQLLTDFGRTSSIAQSAKLRSAAQTQNVANTRAQVLLEVRAAYYQALASQSILKVARATLDLRRLSLRQANALAQSSLRSTLDVSFAQVVVSEAELTAFRAESDLKANHARLSAALGYEKDQPFTLIDEPLPSAPHADADAMIAEAMQNRPDLAALRLHQDALVHTADAERRLRNPTISAAAVAGTAPVHDDRIKETYAAAGVNVSIPVLNGGLFGARRAEAESRAAAAAKDVQALAVQISRDVRVAWLEADDAFQRLTLTAKLVSQADEAARLAQARYDNSLGSIVELNQAQLSQTSAQIAAAAAKYEYLTREALLNYAAGNLR